MRISTFMKIILCNFILLHIHNDSEHNIKRINN